MDGVPAYCDMRLEQSDLPFLRPHELVSVRFPSLLTTPASDDSLRKLTLSIRLVTIAALYQRERVFVWCEKSGVAALLA